MPSSVILLYSAPLVLSLTFGTPPESAYVKALNPGDLVIEEGLFLNKDAAIYLDVQLEALPKQCDLMVKRKEAELNAMLYELGNEVSYLQRENKDLKKQRRRNRIIAIVGSIGLGLLGVGLILK